MPRSGKLVVRPVPVTALPVDAIDLMWALYAGHYDHVNRSDFERDLAEKDTVFVGRDGGSGEVVGFSTARFYTQRFRGRDVGVYFSGDTIVHPSYWGQRALHGAVFRRLLSWRLCHPWTPLYWYLICSGYRTYLTLVRNFPNHWPHHERETPAWEAGLIDALSRARYPAAWQPESGVVSLGDGQPVVKACVAPFTPAILALPEVAFFARRNRGYARGDELAMIARVDLAAVRQVLGRARRGRGRRRQPSVRATPRPELTVS